MTDDGIELGSHRRSHNLNATHDLDGDTNDDVTKGHRFRYYRHRPQLLMLRRDILAFLRHGKSYHELVCLLLLPTLYFRFFPFLLTHNSMPLSVYLAAVFVYIPAKVVLSTWRAYSGGRRKMKNSALLLSAERTAQSGTTSFIPARSIGAARGSKTVKTGLWLCGALFSVWVYTWGISSPFPSASAIVSSSATLQAHQARNASYFIAASFWRNEEILDSWTAQTLKLIDSLGRSNVYVSLTENDSDDNTASKLLHFGRELTQRKVMHSVNITTDLRGYPPENPWHSIRHRMGYMANLRNGALKPLETLNRRFENIILLNDVVYHHTDVLKLIAAVGGDDLGVNARQGRDSNAPGKQAKRRMACSIDMDGAALYDTWVLRDRCGRAVSGFWPFFTSEEDKRSVRNGQVLDVGTCWNGIVVLDGDMFLDKPLRSETADWPKEPLRFGQPPDCIISECALLPLTVTNTTGGSPVVMDTSVIVGYTVKWWKYYAVWLRLPVVQLWMKTFEEGYWGIWWVMGLGEGLKWNGLDNGKEQNECVVKGWPMCGSEESVQKGGLQLKLRKDEL